MKNFYRLLTALASIILIEFSANAQNIGIGTATPAQKLEIAGSTNTIRVNGLTSGGSYYQPATSNSALLYVNNATGDLYALPSGSSGMVLSISSTGVPTWTSASAAVPGWSLTGNTVSVTSGANVIGTINAVPLEFISGGNYVGTLDYQQANVYLGGASATPNAGNWTNGINTSTPGYPTGGANTVGIGAGALSSLVGYNTSNGLIYDNVAIGYYALYSFNPATNSQFTSASTAVGATSLEWASTGYPNDAFGYQALNDVTTGTNNVAVGYNSLNGGAVYAPSGYTMSYNTAIGQNTMTTLTTGSQNTALGYGASVASSSQSNSIAIGYNASAPATNAMVLGNTLNTALYLPGYSSAGSLLYTSASSGLVALTGVGSAGQVLVSGGTGAPTWSSGSGQYIQNQSTSQQTANFWISGNAGIGTTPVATQQLTVAAPSGGVAVAVSASGSGSIGVVATTTASSGGGIEGNNTGGGFGVYGNVSGNTSSNNGGYGVEGAASAGGTGVWANSSGQTNGSVPLGGFGLFATGTYNSQAGVYAFLNGVSGGTPSPHGTTIPALGALYAQTTSTSSTTNANAWVIIANNSGSATPTNNGLLVFGTTSEVGTVTLGANNTTYFTTGGAKANGTLVFDNSSNTNTVTINTGITSATYGLTLPVAQGAVNSVLYNADGAGALAFTATGTSGQVLTLSGGVPTWVTPSGGTITGVGTTAPIYNTGTSSSPVIAIQGLSTGTDAGGVLYSTGAGTSAVFNLTGAAGQVLLSGGTGVPTWGNANAALSTSNITNTGSGSSVVVGNGNNQVVGSSPVTLDVQGTSGGIFYGTGLGTSATFTSAGTANEILLSGGSGVPTWVTGSGQFIQNQSSVAQTANFYITGNVSIGTAGPLATQALTVTTGTLGNIGIVGSNTFAVAAGSGNGAAGVVGLGNGGIITFKDSSALYMDIGVYGSSGAGSYVRSTGAGYIGVGVLGLAGGSSTSFPNSQPLPSAAGVVGASNNGGVGVVGMTSKGGTGVFATTASTNGQSAPLPVSGYGVFAVGSSKSENAVYGFLGSGNDQFPLTTVPAVGASIYATTNLTGLNSNVNLQSYALAAVNNNSTTAPTGNGLLVYGTSNEVGTVTLGENNTTYMTGGVAANGTLVFDNSSNTNQVTINTGVTSASYGLTLPVTQGGTGSLLYNTNGVGALAFTATGTSGQVLTANSSGIPTWGSANTSLTTNNVITSTTGVTITNGTGQVVGGSDVSVDIATNSATLLGLVPAPTGNNLAYVSNGTGAPGWASANSTLTTNNVGSSTPGVTITNGTGQVVGGSNVSVDIATNSATLPGLVPAPIGDNLAYVSNGSGVPGWASANSVLSTNDITNTGGGSSVVVNNGAGQVVGASNVTVDVQGTVSNQGGIFYSAGSGISAVFTATGTSGYVLVSGGTGTPTWATANSALTTSSIVPGAGSSVVVGNGAGQVVGASNVTVDVRGTTGGIFYGQGTGTAAVFTSAGTSGQVLESNGTGTPTWSTGSGQFIQNQNSGVQSTANFDISGSGQVGTTMTVGTNIETQGFEGRVDSVDGNGSPTSLTLATDAYFVDVTGGSGSTTTLTLPTFGAGLGQGHTIYIRNAETSSNTVTVQATSPAMIVTTGTSHASSSTTLPGSSQAGAMFIYNEANKYWYRVF